MQRAVSNILGATWVVFVALGVGLLNVVLEPMAIGSTAIAAQVRTHDAAVKKIQRFYDTLLESMKHAAELGVKGRYKKLKSTIDATFDFSAMTEAIIGPNWERISSAERKALTDAFRRMTIANYARNFDGYNDEAFVVDPHVSERAGDKIVNSTMTAPGKAPIPFIYRLSKTAEGWKIVDVYLNGYISEVATKRADFTSTLANGGPKALIKKLNAVTEKTLNGQ